MPTDQQLFLNIPKPIKSKITTDGSGNYMIDDGTSKYMYLYIVSIGLRKLCNFIEFMN
ncbi:unnamed protein product [Schistosoma mattheei]|uniref:Uncharacterized protein n=1 Tax=Schistosoma mattheei TaxID=31246 RepID=A0A183Q075_9TREM|nr:unnamed protein product [Schistosoma mattheei]